MQVLPQQQIMQPQMYQQVPMQQQPMMVQGGGQMMQQQPMMMQQQPMMMQQQPMMMQQQPMMMQQQPMMMQQQPMMMQQQPMMMQQQPMMMQQQIMVVQQANPIHFMKAFDKLKAMKGIFIKQKMDLTEVITGCDTENKYQIFGCKDDGDIDKKLPLFKAKEKSDFCSRQFLSADCRPFKMKVEHEADNAVSSTDGTLAFSYNRECQCTCLCFNRPTLDVYFEEGGQNYKLGYIKNPWTCCDLELQIYDNHDKLQYIVSGSCCQLGIWCKFPCESCETVDFIVYDEHRQQQSTLQKRSQGCIKSALSSADNFSLKFPINATGEHRALLMAAVIMLDFTYFEEKQDPNQHHHHDF